jgi:hypothetical protein
VASKREGGPQGKKVWKWSVAFSVLICLGVSVVKSREMHGFSAVVVNEEDFMTHPVQGRMCNRIHNDGNAS